VVTRKSPTEIGRKRKDYEDVTYVGDEVIQDHGEVGNATGWPDEFQCSEKDRSAKEKQAYEKYRQMDEMKASRL
jgi:hypothetical protein